METEFAAFVAIDWADRKHVFVLQAAGCLQRESGVIEHSPESVEVWAAQLRHRFGNRPIAVAVEQSRGPLVFMLSKYEHLVVFPVHPTTLAHYRMSFRPSGAKDDPGDADLLLELLRLHRDKLRRLNPDTEETRTLQFLVEDRRKLVAEKTRTSNRITAAVKKYYPQVLEWFEEVGTVLVAEFLQQWPTLEQLQRAKPATIERFFRAHNSRSVARIRQRLEQIEKAIPATTDAAVVVGCSTAVVAWAGLLKQLLEAIAGYDRQIEALAREQPDYGLMRSFPGAGAVLAPRLLVALGTQRERYESAEQLQCYSGIAPVVSRSGQQCWVHWRWSCPKFVRQSFHEWAQHSVGHSKWARAYYQQQRDKGKPHNTVIRALAYKWIRILFRCWKDRTPYDEALYQNRLAARRQKRFLVDQPVKLQWKTVAGMSKISRVGA